ncbi:armadillo repeat-containing protein 7-like isoform X1 [Uloborus diversus]|uniref:armadillo repeat-containing protein 7-like isoform X1 n=1 Tax=Uloborus diversus TaxID=327109 RepID=UPI0024096915|nr:armadillo repeat-containing protein 7-like isoform X1 [Uloborus diversus]XP_054719544.1 armadillo repeat-containing protein 7-like isoform X1 [Uloborus diversus]
MPRKQHDKAERFRYLRELVVEFQDTSSPSAKQEVLANLANFAYDPDNYDHFRELNIVDLFLDQLDETNEDLVEFAIGGICNLALDKNFKHLIYTRNGISNVIKCLSSRREETVLSAITTLMFLVSPESKADIVNPSVIDCMLRFKDSSNRRLSNLANVFLQDYCSNFEIENTKKLAANYRETQVTTS